MAIVQRPNQEALVRGLNIYRDTMRPFILTTLRGVHGSDVTDVIKSSLNEEGAASFERDLERNEGNVDETLDVGHFRPIIENNWDMCFSVHFGYDRTVFGTLGWITGARNQASHPGTQDIDRNEVISAFTNIIKVLNYINATGSVSLLEDMRDQVSTMPQPAAPVERSETSTQTTASKCANRRCTSINEHHMDQSGPSSVVCVLCGADYSTQTFVVVRYDRHYSGQEKTNNYSLRVRLPSGQEDVHEFQHPENLQLNRNDRITISYDRDDNMTYLLNHDLNRWYYFDGGEYRSPSKTGKGWFERLWMGCFLGGVIGSIILWMLRGLGLSWSPETSLIMIAPLMILAAYLWGKVMDSGKSTLAYIAIVIFGVAALAISVIIGDEIDIMEIVVSGIIIVLGIGVILYSKVKEKLKDDLKGKYIRED